MLKVVAIIAMFVDHAVWLLPEDAAIGPYLHAFGRIAAPTMCYLIAEGFAHTSNVNKYISRLFMFAIISHLPYVLYFDLSWWKATSVIWSLLLGLVALSVSQKPNWTMAAKVVVIVLCCLLAWPGDWNFIAVLWILFFGTLRGSYVWQMVSFAAIGAVFYIIPGFVHSGWEASFHLGILLVIPLFALYNGLRGRKSNWIKWSFYVFYPVHLVVLYVIKSFMKM